MISSQDLPTVLKDYLTYTEGKPSAHCYLTYQPGSGTWSYFDGSMVDHVWSNFNNPMITTVLRLEPAGAIGALAADPPEAFQAAVERYATFTASRPHHTGLHHFAQVDEPEALTKERTSPDQTVN